MNSVASPMACVPVAQAVEMVALGPSIWNRSAIMKAGMFGTPVGSMNGLTLVCPCSLRIMAFSSSLSTPPMAVPKYTPLRSGSGARPS